MSFLHDVGSYSIGPMVIFHNFFVMEKYMNTSLYADCSCVSTIVASGLRGLAKPPNLPSGPLTCLEVWWRVPTRGTRLRSVTPFTDGAAAGT